MTATTTEVPAMSAELAEIATTKNITLTDVRTLDGIGRQVVNIAQDGEHVHQLSHYGTRDQAYAMALLGFCHDTEPEWFVLRAIVLGK